MNRQTKVYAVWFAIGVLFISVGLFSLLWIVRQHPQSFLYDTLHFSATFLGTDGNFSFRLDFLNGTHAQILFVGINQANSAANYLAEGDSWVNGLLKSVKAGDNLTFTFLRPATLQNDVTLSILYQGSTGPDIHSCKWAQFLWHYPYSEVVTVWILEPSK